MSKQQTLHVGTDEDMAKRFAEAWHRAEQGQDVSESHLTFLDLDSLLVAVRHEKDDPAHGGADQDKRT